MSPKKEPKPTPNERAPKVVGIVTAIDEPAGVITISAASPCTTCGNPVAVGATCVVDGTVSL